MPLLLPRFTALPPCCLDGVHKRTSRAGVTGFSTHTTASALFGFFGVGAGGARWRRLGFGRWARWRSWRGWRRAGGRWARRRSAEGRWARLGRWHGAILLELVQVVLVVALEILEGLRILVGDDAGALTNLVGVVLHDLLLVCPANLFLSHGTGETELRHGEGGDCSKLWLLEVQKGYLALVWSLH